MYIYILYIFLINRIDKHVKHYILMLTEKNRKKYIDNYTRVFNANGER